MVAVAAECTLVTLAESVTVVFHCTSGDGRVAEISMAIGIGSPASRHVVTAGFKSIVETPLSEALMCGGIWRRII
jgi:hypothetical protein